MCLFLFFKYPFLKLSSFLPFSSLYLIFYFCMYLYLLSIFFLSTYISLCLILSHFLIFASSYLFLLSHFLFFFSPYLFSSMPFFFFMSGFLFFNPPFLKLYLTLFLLCFSLSACFIFFLNIIPLFCLFTFL